MSSATLAYMVAHGITVRAAPLGLPVGSQTYPHRARIASDGLKGFDALLKDMKGIGIDAVELCNPPLGDGAGYKEFAALSDGKATRKILDDNGIRALSAHFNINALRKQHKQNIDWALALGMTQMSTATLTGATKDGVTTLDEVKRAADEYNKIAAVAAKNGLKQALHNEGFENSRLPDGRRTYFALMEHFDPKLVFMQFQMSSMRGMDINPIQLFHTYPGRIISLHVQGVNMNPPPAYAPAGAAAAPAAAPAAPAAGAAQGGRAGAAGGAAQGAAAGRAGGAGRGGGGGGYAAGSDDLEWGRIFEAGKIGGLQNYFVEQSWPLTMLSVAYLRNLNV
jgi:sugar phosphate isomerase/epimerase